MHRLEGGLCGDGEVVVAGVGDPSRGAGYPDPIVGSKIVVLVSLLDRSAGDFL